MPAVPSHETAAPVSTWCAAGSAPSSRCVRRATSRFERAAALPASAGAEHEEGRVGERAGVRRERVGVPARRPAAVARPLRPERAARREVGRDVVEHGLGRRDVVVVADAAAVPEQRVRVRDAADPRHVHRVAVAALADAVAVEGGGLEQPRRVGAVVPAVQPVAASSAASSTETQAALGRLGRARPRSTRRQSPSLRREGERRRARPAASGASGVRRRRVSEPS